MTTALCPYCKAPRAVMYGQTQSATEELIEVYSIQCDHRWKLSREESRKLREKFNIVRSP